jgi:hypothetical protein
MKETHVIREKVTRTKNTIKGKFYLSDKTITSFDIDKEYGWNQWGNSTNNLCITVNRVEQLQNELLDL